MPRSALSAGASVDVDGWSVAAFYDDPAREYAALCDGAALVDLAYRARVRVTGGDRVDFLQGMLSNDVKRLAPGGGCAALLLTEQGKIVADCIVLALADAILLDARASATVRAAEALARYVVADDVELEAEAGTHAVGVFGPGATEALATAGITAPPQAPFAHVTVEVDGATMRIVRVPDPAAGGYLCIGGEPLIER